MAYRVVSAQTLPFFAGCLKRFDFVNRSMTLLSDVFFKFSYFVSEVDLVIVTDCYLGHLISSSVLLFCLSLFSFLFDLCDRRSWLNKLLNCTFSLISAISFPLWSSFVLWIRGDYVKPFMARTSCHKRLNVASPWSRTIVVRVCDKRSNLTYRLEWASTPPTVCSRMSKKNKNPNFSFFI